MASLSRSHSSRTGNRSWLRHRAGRSMALAFLRLTRPFLVQSSFGLIPHFRCMCTVCLLAAPASVLSRSDSRAHADDLWRDSVIAGVAVRQSLLTTPPASSRENVAGSGSHRLSSRDQDGVPLAARRSARSAVGDLLISYSRWGVPGIAAISWPCREFLSTAREFGGVMVLARSRCGTASQRRRLILSRRMHAADSDQGRKDRSEERAGRPRRLWTFRTRRCRPVLRVRAQPDADRALIRRHGGKSMRAARPNGTWPYYLVLRLSAVPRPAGYVHSIKLWLLFNCLERGRGAGGPAPSRASVGCSPPDGAGSGYGQ